MRQNQTIKMSHWFVLFISSGEPTLTHKHINGVIRHKICHLDEVYLFPFAHYSLSQYLNFIWRVKLLPWFSASWLCHHQPHGVSSDHHWVVSVNTNRRYDPQSAVTGVQMLQRAPLEQVSTTLALVCLEVVQQCPRLARQVNARLVDVRVTY